MALTPQTWTLTVNGVDRTSRVSKRTLSIENTRGSRSLLSMDLFDTLDGPGAYLPALDQEVILTVAGTRRFGGYITDIAHEPLAGFRGTKSACKVGGYDMVCDRITVTESYGNTLIPILIAAIWSPTYITTDGPHGFLDGQRVRIEGNMGAVPPVVNGDHIITAMPHPANFGIPVNVTQAAGGGGTARRVWTMREVLTHLGTKYLPQFGLSLELAFAGDGPLLEPLDFTNAKFTDVMNYFTTTHQLMWFVTPLKKLRVFFGGTVHSGLTLNGANTNAPVGWALSRKQYVNRVILSIGGAQKVPMTQIFHADGQLKPGGKTLYVTTYPCSTDIYADPHPNLVIKNNAVWAAALWWGHHQDSTPWVWDWRNHTMIHNYAADPQTGYLPLALGDTLTVSYTAQFPFDVIAQDPVDVQPPPVGKGPWEERFAIATITDKAQGQAIADGLLVQLMGSEARTLELGSLTGFVNPGEMATLDFPRRHINPSPWMIESITTSLISPVLWWHEYAFTEGTDATKTWADYVKELTRQPAGGVGSASAPISGAFPPSAPPGPGGTPTGGGGGSWFLGGDGTTSVQVAENTWLPIDGTTPAGGAATQIELDTAKLGVTTVTVRARLRAGQTGLGVRARLWKCDEGGAVAGTSTYIVSNQWTTVEFTCGLTTGAHPYECQLSSDALAPRDVFGTAYIK